MSEAAPEITDEEVPDDLLEDAKDKLVDPAETDTYRDGLGTEAAPDDGNPEDYGQDEENQP